MHKLAARPGFRPGMGRHLAQVVLDAGGEAFGIAVFDQDVGRRTGKEALEFFRLLYI